MRLVLAWFVERQNSAIDQFAMILHFQACFAFVTLCSIPSAFRKELGWS